MGFFILLTPAMFVFVIALINCCFEKKENFVHGYSAFEPFLVSEYLERIEKKQLEILEEKNSIDQTVILWWGLDGLTLDENGELKWISRKKKAPSFPVYPGYFDFMQNMYNASFPVYPTGCAQTATIRDLQMQNVALQMQACQQTQMQNMTSQLQNCCARPT